MKNGASGDLIRLWFCNQDKAMGGLVSDHGLITGVIRYAAYNRAVPSSLVFPDISRMVSIPSKKFQCCVLEVNCVQCLFGWKICGHELLVQRQSFIRE